MQNKVSQEKNKQRTPHFPYDYGESISEIDNERRFSTRIVNKLTTLKRSEQIIMSVSVFLLVTYGLRQQSLQSSVPVEIISTSKSKKSDEVFAVCVYTIAIRAIWWGLGIYKDDITPLLGVFEILTQFKK